MRRARVAAAAVGLTVGLTSVGAMAQTKYVSPKATFERVEQSAELKTFTDKFYETSGGETEKDVASFFSDDTEIFVVNADDKPVSIGKFDRSKSKISEIGRALAAGKPKAKPLTLAKIKDFNQEMTLETGLNPGTFPGHPGRVCGQPIISMDSKSLAPAIASVKPQKADANVTLETLPVHAGPDDSKARDKRVIETIPAKQGIVFLDIIGNGYEWNAKILTPSGKIGYVDQSLIVSVTPRGYCFGQQPNGTWLIDAVIR
jgi:hypothetical protein